MISRFDFYILCPHIYYRAISASIRSLLIQRVDRDQEADLTILNFAVAKNCKLEDKVIEAKCRLFKIE